MLSPSTTLDSWWSRLPQPSSTTPPGPQFPVVSKLENVLDVDGDEKPEIVDLFEKWANRWEQISETMMEHHHPKWQPKPPRQFFHLVENICDLGDGLPVTIQLLAVSRIFSSVLLLRSTRWTSKKHSHALSPSPLSTLHSPLSSGLSFTSDADYSISATSSRSLGLHSPTKNQFREGSMLALADVMSRIQGALSDMPPGDSGHSVSDEREASAQRVLDGDVQCSSHCTHVRAGVSSSRLSINVLLGAFDDFALSQVPCPTSTTPSQTRSRRKVLFDRHRRAQDPISRRVLDLWKLRPRPSWWDMSWDPPVEGMSCKSLSRDEVLFSLAIETFAVALPKNRSLGSSSPPSYASPPRVQLPSGHSDRAQVYELETGDTESGFNPGPNYPLVTSKVSRPQNVHISSEVE